MRTRRGSLALIRYEMVQVRVYLEDEKGPDSKSGVRALVVYVNGDRLSTLIERCGNIAYLSGYRVSIKGAVP
jgi:hypothetical protein